MERSWEPTLILEQVFAGLLRHEFSCKGEFNRLNDAGE